MYKCVRPAERENVYSTCHMCFNVCIPSLQVAPDPKAKTPAKASVPSADGDANVQKKKANVCCVCITTKMLWIYL